MSAFPEKFADVNKAAVDAALGYSTIGRCTHALADHTSGILAAVVCCRCGFRLSFKE